MANPTPMSRETHLKRGTCCNCGCVFCPWRVKPARPPLAPSLLLGAMELLKEDPDAEMVYYSRYQANIPSTRMQDRITIIYNNQSND